MSIEFEKEMPLGLAFQMAANEKAMSRFGAMSEEEKRKVVDAAKTVHSKNEMRNIVEDLGKA